MSVETNVTCPRCKHNSWEGEMNVDNYIQHCADCKETFITPPNGEPEYFYETAVARLAIWKCIRANKKLPGTFNKIVSYLKSLL